MFLIGNLYYGRDATSNNDNCTVNLLIAPILFQITNNYNIEIWYNEINLSNTKTWFYYGYHVDDNKVHESNYF